MKNKRAKKPLGIRAFKKRQKARFEAKHGRKAKTRKSEKQWKKEYEKYLQKEIAKSVKREMGLRISQKKVGVFNTPEYVNEHYATPEEYFEAIYEANKNFIDYSLQTSDAKNLFVNNAKDYMERNEQEGMGSSPVKAIERLSRNNAFWDSKDDFFANYVFKKGLSKEDKMRLNEEFGKAHGDDDDSFDINDYDLKNDDRNDKYEYAYHSKDGRTVLVGEYIEENGSLPTFTWNVIPAEEYENWLQDTSKPFRR